MAVSFSKKESPILKLPIRFDRKKLEDLFSEKKIYEQLRESSSLSLVSQGSSSDSQFDGTTSKVIAGDQEFYFSEGDFKHVIENLKSTYFEEIYKLLSQEIPGRLGRVRLFSRPPRTSSSFHKDLDVRFHFALKTTGNSFLVFPDRGLYRIPSDDHLYLVNTTIPHFAVNTDNESERVHMIINTYCGFRETRALQDEIVKASLSLFEEFRGREDVVEC